MKQNPSDPSGQYQGSTPPKSAAKETVSDAEFNAALRTNANGPLGERQVAQKAATSWARGQ